MPLANEILMSAKLDESKIEAPLLPSELPDSLLTYFSAKPDEPAYFVDIPVTWSKIADQKSIHDFLTPVTLTEFRYITNIEALPITLQFIFFNFKAEDSMTLENFSKQLDKHFVGKFVSDSVVFGKLLEGKESLEVSGSIKSDSGKNQSVKNFFTMVSATKVFCIRFISNLDLTPASRFYALLDKIAQSTRLSDKTQGFGTEKLMANSDVDKYIQILQNYWKGEDKNPNSFYYYRNSQYKLGFIVPGNLTPRDYAPPLLGSFEWNAHSALEFSADYLNTAYSGVNLELRKYVEQMQVETIKLLNDTIPGCFMSEIKDFQHKGHQCLEHTLMQTKDTQLVFIRTHELPSIKDRAFTLQFSGSMTPSDWKLDLMKTLTYESLTFLT